MSNLDERVSLLESGVQGHAAQMAHLREIGAEVRQEIRDLRQDVKQVTSELRDEIRQLRSDMNLRFDAIDRRFELMDRRFELMDRRFTWFAGMMVTGFIAVIGTVAGTFWGLLRTLN